MSARKNPSNSGAEKTVKPIRRGEDPDSFPGKLRQGEHRGVVPIYSYWRWGQSDANGSLSISLLNREKQENHLNMATIGAFTMQKRSRFQRVSRQFPAPHEQGMRRAPTVRPPRVRFIFSPPVPRSAAARCARRRGGNNQPVAPRLARGLHRRPRVVGKPAYARHRARYRCRNPLRGCRRRQAPGRTPAGYPQPRRALLRGAPGRRLPRSSATRNGRKPSVPALRAK